MKKFVAGLLVGVALSATTVAFADSNISAMLTNIKFQIDGKVQPLPSGYAVLGYEGHTYVPARFLAEQLGATVDYDTNTRTVIVNSKSQDFVPTGDMGGGSNSNGNGTSQGGGSVSTSPISLPQSIFSGMVSVTKASFSKTSSGTDSISYVAHNNTSNKLIMGTIHINCYDANGKLIADAGTLFSAEPGEDASYNEMLFSDATDSYDVDVSKIAKVEFTTSN